MLNNDVNERITLDSLADLTGFPVEMIKKELFDNHDLKSDEEISLPDLRKAMMSFIDETMIEDKKTKSNKH